MRIIVISDSHGNFKRLHWVVKRHLESTDLFLHLGDGLQELEDIRCLYPKQKFLAVHGNCDRYFDEKLTRTIDCDGTKVFACHGDIYGVKSNLDKLKIKARMENASIALYGHTHKNFTDYEDGLYIMNPGSITLPRNGLPSYGVIDITKAGIAMHTVEVERF